MENPNITIAIDKGPKKGETLDCSPGSVIRIGRVVRGNTLAIKDPGISHKHITVAFHQDISRWSVTDLGTSNGTIVNGTVISPDAPFPLSNGDNIKIGEKTLISVKISAPIFAPEPRTRRGRMIAAAAATSLIKIVDPENHVGKDRFQGNICSNSANIDEDIKRMPEEGKRGRTRRGSLEVCFAKGPKEKEDVDVKENAIDLNQNNQKCPAKRKRGIASTRVSMNNKVLDSVTIENSVGILKEKDVERKVGHEKVVGTTNNGGKRRGRAKSGVETTRVLRKDTLLGHVAVEDEKVMIMKEEYMEALKMTERLVKNLVEGRVDSKRCGGPVKVTCKDELLEPVVVPPRKGRVTRASTMTMNITALVGTEHNGEDKKTKKEKVEETSKNRGKCRERGKTTNRSTKILRKGEKLDSVKIDEKIVESLSRPLDVTVTSSDKVLKDIQKNKVMAKLNLGLIYLAGQEKGKSIVKNNSICDGKKFVASREVSFVVEEETHKDTMMSGESNKADDLHFSNKNELVYSWSSFSEIRGIPNTTSKYREDRMINCHATPFEARVERALNRGIAETSSSMEI